MPTSKEMNDCIGPEPRSDVVVLRLPEPVPCVVPVSHAERVIGEASGRLCVASGEVVGVLGSRRRELGGDRVAVVQAEEAVDTRDAVGVVGT